MFPLPCLGFLIKVIEAVTFIVVAADEERGYCYEREIQFTNAERKYLLS